MPVEKRSFESFAGIFPVSKTTLAELSELFFDSFIESVEFCDISEDKMRKRSVKNIDNFFKNKRGIASLELSRIAVLSGEKNRLVGACLISRYEYGFKNEILFVRPKYQNRGIGTALVSNVLIDLSKMGEETFWSERHICNEQSAAWHAKFGFIEEPDIMTARFRRSYLRREVWRNESLGNLQKLEELKFLLEKAEAEVERLKVIEKEDFDAAWLRWKYDY